jgi:hypothetical protein
LSPPFLTSTLLQFVWHVTVCVLAMGGIFSTELDTKNESWVLHFR